MIRLLIVDDHPAYRRGLELMLTTSSDIEIVGAIREGVDNNQRVLCPEMPRYNGSAPNVPAMTDLEAYAIVAYLRSLPANSTRTPSELG